MRNSLRMLLTLNGAFLLLLPFQNCAPKRFTVAPRDPAAVGVVTRASVASPALPAPVATSPVATSPVATSPVATSPVATSPVATSPVATRCANGATNYPLCTDCGGGRHLEGATCVSNTRDCQIQPLNSAGGFQTFLNGGWGACTYFSCNQNYFIDNGVCVKGCGDTREQYQSWGLSHIGIEKRCQAQVPRLRDGQSATLNSANGNPGFIKVSCVDSQYRFASEPTYGSHTDSEWQRYMVRVFRNDSSLDIACHNELILFQQPRLFESCETPSSAACSAAIGDTPTATNICHPTKVYMDDLGIQRTTLFEGRYLGQHFGTQYRVYIKTSKDNFAASYDITADIGAGYGQAMDSANPIDLYSGRLPGFSFVARNDMAGHQIKVFVEGKTYLNGVQRQANTVETSINVRQDSSCVNNYNGTGVANFVIGASLNSEPNTMVRRGYAWPLHP